MGRTSHLLRAETAGRKSRRWTQRTAELAMRTPGGVLATDHLLGLSLGTKTLALRARKRVTSLNL